MLTTIAVANYRSLRDLVVPLKRLNVVTGANGSGKSSLYRALRLLSEAAQGGLVRALAREGGLRSTLWAGPETIARSVKRGQQPVQGTVRKDAVHLRLGFAADDFGYAVDFGMPVPGLTAFTLDPAIKREVIWAGPVFRPAALMVDRRGPSLRATDAEGAWRSIPGGVSAFESMMTEYADPQAAPEMLIVRERIRSWRFYDHFSTDADAPARLPQVGTYTPVLADTGDNLAAALQTIREIGDAPALDGAIADAFAGASLDLVLDEGRFEVAMRQHGLLRPLRAGELSDGTLRYLLLTAALLTPRPPQLLVLNEPETSLHPDLIPALGRLVADAATRTQVIVVTHSAALAEALAAHAANPLHLEKVMGETVISGQSLLERPRWAWPPR